MSTYMEHLGTLPWVADKALGMRRRVDLYLVRMNIFHQFKFSFPAQVTEEMEFLMFCSQMCILYLEAKCAEQGRVGVRGLEGRHRLEGQTLWSQKLVKRLGSGFVVSPRARGNKMVLFPLSGSGIPKRWVYFSTLKWTGQNESLLAVYQCG